MTPPGRTGLPKKLGSLGIAQGDELGPLPDYGRRNAVTMQRQAVLFHMSSRGGYVAGRLAKGRA
ncbi:hypothetical protein GCM10007880_50490 [Mesorhizobium amorphae]|nr:hypothetical protein GCM10007880_50490 [Mesorhizobium amorphae]